MDRWTDECALSLFLLFFFIIGLHVYFISRCLQWKSTSRGRLVGVDGPAGQASKE